MTDRTTPPLVCPDCLAEQDLTEVEAITKEYLCSHIDGDVEVVDEAPYWRIQYRTEPDDPNRPPLVCSACLKRPVRLGKDRDESVFHCDHILGGILARQIPGGWMLRVGYPQSKYIEDSVKDMRREDEIARLLDERD